jgi:hypothetical protein
MVNTNQNIKIGKDMKTVREACKYYASFIYDHGTRLINKNEGCLNPESNNKNNKTMSKILFKKFKATHFTRYWSLDHRGVIIDLYSGDSFGACLNLGDSIHTEEFHIDELEKM